MSRLAHIAVCTAALLALSAVELAAQSPSGRALYLGHQPFAAGRAATTNQLPPQFAACVSCHGPLAEGRREGGIVAPPVTWAALMRPQAEEHPYDTADQVLRAVAEGMGRNGRLLGPGMPRFRLSQPEADALISHLRIAGTSDDRPPGVQDAIVEIGTVLPLSGPAATIGRAVMRGMGEVISELASMGGVNGRRISLVAEDSAGGQSEAAVRRLLAKPVYAVIGGLWVGGGPADALLAAARVPHIGSLVVRTSTDAGSWVADLLPPLDVQQAALIQAFERCSAGLPRLALWVDNGLAEHHAARGGDGARWFTDPVPLVIALQTMRPPGCVGFDLKGMAALGNAVPQGWRKLLILPFPPAVLASGTHGGRGEPWYGLGRASARLTVELLARSGAVLHERSLLDKLAETTGFAPLPGAPVKFALRRRYAWDPADLDLAIAGDATPDQGNPAGGSRP